MAVDKQRALAEQYFATQQQNQAIADRQAREQQLGSMESLLGTDAQVNGTLGSGGDSNLNPYLGRYSLDTGGLQSVYAGKTAKQRATFEARYNANLGTANGLLDQAEQAARAGDFNQAAQLRSQAQIALTKTDGSKQYFGPVVNTDQIQSLFKMGGMDPSVLAQQQLNSPLAQLAGRQVQEARQFMDWDSEASVRQRQLLGEEGERAIGATERGALRSARNSRMQGGAADTPYASRMLDERTRQQAGFDRANLHAQVNSAFLDFSRQYARNTTGFAQAFLQNEPGIREQYQGALDNLRLNLSNLATHFSDQYQSFEENYLARKFADNAATVAYHRSMMAAITGMLGGSISGGIQMAGTGGTSIPNGGGMMGSTSGSLTGPGTSFGNTGSISAGFGSALGTDAAAGTAAGGAMFDTGGAALAALA